MKDKATKENELAMLVKYKWDVVQTAEDKLEVAKRELEDARKDHYVHKLELQRMCKHDFGVEDIWGMETCRKCDLARTVIE